MKSLVLGAVAAALLYSGATVAQDHAAKVSRGEAVFERWCAACHSGEAAPNYSGGTGLPGTAALRAKYKGAVPAELAARTDMAPEFIKLFVRQGISVMAPFRKTEVTDADLDALTAYLTRNNSK